MNRLAFTFAASLLLAGNAGAHEVPGLSLSTEEYPQSYLIWPGEEIIFGRGDREDLPLTLATISDVRQLCRWKVAEDCCYRCGEGLTEMYLGSEDGKVAQDMCFYYWQKRPPYFFADNF